MCTCKNSSIKFLVLLPGTTLNFSTLVIFILFFNLVLLLVFHFQFWFFLFRCLAYDPISKKWFGFWSRNWKNCKVFEKANSFAKTNFATIFTRISYYLRDNWVFDDKEMTKENRNNGNNQQQVVQPPTGLRLRDIERPVIAASSHCIRLSDGARNYELKTIHFRMLPAFHG